MKWRIRKLTAVEWVVFAVVILWLIGIILLAYYYQDPSHYIPWMPEGAGFY